MKSRAKSRRDNKRRNLARHMRLESLENRALMATLAGTTAWDAETQVDPYICDLAPELAGCAKYAQPPADALDDRLHDQHDPIVGTDPAVDAAMEEFHESHLADDAVPTGLMGRPDGGNPAPAGNGDHQGQAGNIVPQVIVDDAEVVEEGKSVSFTIRLTQPSDTNVTVHYRTEDGMAVGTQADGTGDYRATDKSNTVVFRPGQTEITVVVVTNDDTRAEPTEDFHLQVTRVSSTAPVTIGDGQGTATIRDNDGGQSDGEVEQDGDARHDSPDQDAEKEDGEEEGDVEQGAPCEIDDLICDDIDVPIGPLFGNPPAGNGAPQGIPAWPPGPRVNPPLGAGGAGAGDAAGDPEDRSGADGETTPETDNRDKQSAAETAIGRLLATVQPSREQTQYVLGLIEDALTVTFREYKPGETILGIWEKARSFRQWRMRMLALREELIAKLPKRTPAPRTVVPDVPPVRPQYDGPSQIPQDSPTYRGPVPDDAPAPPVRPEYDGPSRIPQDSPTYRGPVPDDAPAPPVRPQYDGPNHIPQDSPTYRGPVPDDAPVPSAQPKVRPQTPGTNRPPVNTSNVDEGLDIATAGKGAGKLGGKLAKAGAIFDFLIAPVMGHAYAEENEQFAKEMGLNDLDAEVYRNLHYVPFFGQPLADTSGCVYCIITTPWGDATVEDVTEPFGLLPFVQSPVGQFVTRPTETLETLVEAAEEFREIRERVATGDRQAIEQVRAADEWIDENVPIVKKVYNGGQQLKSGYNTVARYLPFLPSW